MFGSGSQPREAGQPPIGANAQENSISDGMSFVVMECMMENSRGNSKQRCSQNIDWL